jgi:Uma2 family endonuclease
MSLIQQQQQQPPQQQPFHGVEIVYPETDGEPMAESDIHRDLMVDLIEGLKHHFREDPMTYVSGNMLLYYEEGNPHRSVAPDVFVVRGIAKHRRRIYQLWAEGRPPDVVFEISSRTTWGKDLQKNWRLYARLGIREYFIFDPEYDYLDPSLNAYRLNNGEYEEVDVTDGRVMCETLGLELVDTGKTLRLLDPLTGKFLPVFREIEELRREAEARAVHEFEARREAEVRAETAELEVSRLREELARLRG